MIHISRWPHSRAFLNQLQLNTPSRLVPFLYQTTAVMDYANTNCSSANMAFPETNNIRGRIFSFPFHGTNVYYRSFATFSPSRTVDELLVEVEREKQKGREEELNGGLDTLLHVLSRKRITWELNLLLLRSRKKLEIPSPSNLNRYERIYKHQLEGEKRFFLEAMQRQELIVDKKHKRLEQLVKKFDHSDTIKDAIKWMTIIEKFEQEHFPLRYEYRVIGELLNRLLEATGKEKFILQQKLKRAWQIIEWKEAHDPNNPTNYGVIQNKDASAPSINNYDSAKGVQVIDGLVEDGIEGFDDMKKKDDILMEKLNCIDNELAKNLEELDHTFGKKGKLLEENIRDLLLKRNALTEQKRRPHYGMGFDVRLLDVNRTCKVTKGGQVVKYSVLLACGNYQGVVGFAKAKAPSVPIAIQKATGKCFQNLHFVERHEEHTIAHAIQTTYHSTKLSLWPASMGTGLIAGRTVKAILSLAGLKNVKSKVHVSRNPYNTVKAVFQALNLIETPKDIQEKFGRTVVDSYLL